MRVERSIEIGAPPDRVYQVVMDPRRLGEWVTIHVGLKSAPPGDLERGSQLVQCLRLAGRRFDVHWDVVAADRPSHVVWEGRGPVNSRAKVVYEIHPHGDDRTGFHYMNEYTLPGGPLGRIAGGALRGIAEREAERTLERLKGLVER
jgi:carbon monoxide dehydrogenase subunit G